MNWKFAVEPWTLFWKNDLFNFFISENRIEVKCQYRLVKSNYYYFLFFLKSYIQLSRLSTGAAWGAGAHGSACFWPLWGRAGAPEKKESDPLKIYSYKAKFWRVLIRAFIPFLLLGEGQITLDPLYPRMADFLPPSKKNT